MLLYSRSAVAAAFLARRKAAPPIGPAVCVVFRLRAAAALPSQPQNSTSHTQQQISSWPTPPAQDQGHLPKQRAVGGLSCSVRCSPGRERPLPLAALLGDKSSPSLFFGAAGGVGQLQFSPRAALSPSRRYNSPKGKAGGCCVEERPLLSRRARSFSAPRALLPLRAWAAEEEEGPGGQRGRAPRERPRTDIQQPPVVGFAAIHNIHLTHTRRPSGGSCFTRACGGGGVQEEEAEKAMFVRAGERSWPYTASRSQQGPHVPENVAVRRSSRCGLSRSILTASRWQRLAVVSAHAAPFVPRGCGVKQPLCLRDVCVERDKRRGTTGDVMRPAKWQTGAGPHRAAERRPRAPKKPVAHAAHLGPLIVGLTWPPRWAASAPLLSTRGPFCGRRAAV
jgi:hypothetical protein